MKYESPTKLKRNGIFVELQCDCCYNTFQIRYKKFKDKCKLNQSRFYCSKTCAGKCNRMTEEEKEFNSKLENFPRELKPIEVLWGNFLIF